MGRNPFVTSPPPPRPRSSAVPRSQKSPEAQVKPLTYRDFYFDCTGPEDSSGYVPGGYHPVHIGDIYHERYRVIHKLGYGAYSTVWLTRDLSATKRT